MDWRIFWEQLKSQMSHLNAFFSSWTDLTWHVFWKYYSFLEKLYLFTNVTFGWFLFHMNSRKMYLMSHLENSWNSKCHMSGFFFHELIQGVSFERQWKVFFFSCEAVVTNITSLMVSFSQELILDVFLFHTFGSSCSCKCHIWLVSFSHELMPNVYS